MHVTSRAQHDAWTTSAVPDLERVRENVWALPMLMPHGSAPTSLCYLVRDDDGGVHVIDPGTDVEDNWGALVFALGRIGSSTSDVASIVVTHLHEDHLGLSKKLRRASRAPLILHRAEQEAIDSARRWTVSDEVIDSWGVPESRAESVRSGVHGADRRPDVSADVVVDDGDRLEIAGRDIRVMHTPGHTGGHIVLRDAGEQLLFTGDHVLPDENPGLGLGGWTVSNPVADYLDSLAAVAAFDDHEVLPGHGYRFRGVAVRAEQLAAHHRSRAEDVRRALMAAPDATVWQLASAIRWSAGWQNLHGVYLVSALSQTAMHRELVLADA
jgi:glyoxylase-like metal-dependent hydrolase (beta-lactamase superfamily II)